ncbi:MAG: TIM barrel protein [Armatimonadetes bacterium]|nr:TIM barrel protein [Armatimonadota bacterium]
MSAETSVNKLHLASNAYSWQVYYAREGRDFQKDLAAGLKAVATAGLDGFEPILETPEDAQRIGSALRQAGLEMRSAYVNTSLHRDDDVRASMERVLAVADRAKAHGTRIIVTNPNPIKWGGLEDKSDAELETQAAALDRLGKALAERGMALAYHNHDIELRQAARELHHMLAATDPRYVKLCLDSHWIYRGAGNSQVAMLDVVRLYGSRIVEIHLRQSSGGVWSEVFGDGDIDYARVAGMLKAMRVRPHVVLEQAVETGTPRTMDADAAMRLSGERARALFAGIGRP